MNIIFLTSEAQHHYYLINKINEYHPIKRVFFQTVHLNQPLCGDWIKKLINHLGQARLVIKGLLSVILFGNEKTQQEHYETKMFFKNTVPALDPSIPSEKVLSFNLPQTVTKVSSEQPDLIIVFGTEILKGEILNIAKLDVLNIHRGILPEYRGGGLPHWMFYNNDFKNLGTTIHVCAPKLDAGDIVGQRYYKLQKEDRMYMLCYKTTLLALDILKEIIDKYENGVVEYRKQKITKVWTAKDLGVIKRIIARRNFNRHIRSL